MSVLNRGAPGWAAVRAGDRHRYWFWGTVLLWVAAFVGTAARPLWARHERHSILPDLTSAGGRWVRAEPLYVRGGSNEFRYSPTVAALFAPTAQLPGRWIEFAWRSVNFAALVAGLVYAGRTGLAGRWTAPRACAVFLLVLPVSIGSLNNAQSNPLVLGMMLTAAAAAVDRRWTLSAVAITAATCFKLYPVVLGLLLILQFPRPLAWRLAVGLAVVAIAPFALQRPAYVAHEYASWARYLVGEDRQRGTQADWYRDLRAVSRSYVGHLSQAAYRWVQVVAGAVIAAVCLWARRRRHGSDADVAALATSLGCCWMTALGPATESATYILIAPAIAWGLVRVDAKPGRADGFARVGYGVAWGLLLVAGVAVNVPGGAAFRQRLEPLPIAGLIVLAVELGWASRWVRTEHRF